MELKTKIDFNTANRKDRPAPIEWYTPEYIIDSLGGKFDLDPCAPCEDWYTANKCYTKEIDGLSQEWKGRVFLNPPYLNPDIRNFVHKLADHGNGIALLFANCDNKMFFEEVFNRATSLKILRKRIPFVRPDGKTGNRPGRGSVIVAYGEECDKILTNCKLEGKYIYLNNK